MKDLLKRILQAGLMLEVEDGQLHMFAGDEEVDEALVDEIRKHRKEIIAYLLEHQGGSFENEKYQEIPVCPKAERYPVSNAQLRLWLASQMEEGSKAYNMPNTIVLDGTYDVACFQKAIHAVIERHEILRTVFQVDDQGNIQQVVLSPETLNFAIDIQDLRKEAEVEAKVRAYIATDSNKVFDLEKGPLLRAALLRTSEEQYVLYHNMHHIISDQWSMEVLSRDLMTYYNAYDQGRVPAIQPLRIQYKDYTAWQLDQLETEAYQAHKAFWLTQLSGEVAVLDLPTQKKRPVVKSYNGISLGINLAPATLAKLRSFTAEKGGSLFTGLLAVWKVLLYRYTGQTDITIGNPVAGRDHPDLENQIGFYLQTLALRTKINPKDSFVTLYDQVKDKTLEAYEHQMYPFDQLTEDLEVKREAGRNPLFDILVDYHGASEGQLNAEIEEKVNVFGEGLVKFDMEVHLTEVGGGLNFLVRYNQAIYEQDMVERLLIHYRNLLKNLSAHPEACISEVSFLTQEEEQQLRTTFNATKTAYPKDKTLVDLFEEQVQQSPTTKAITFGERQLTYQALNERSGKLANCLIKEHNVAKGDFVGIHLNRSDEYIVCILAILKAGAVYVPIDTAYPAERKKYIIEDAGIDLMIADTTFLFDADYFEGNLLAIDVAFDDTQYKAAVDVEVRPDDLAYMIYTSGSTGKPKGVTIKHSSVMNYITWAKKNYLNESMSNYNFGWFTSPSFDLTITSLFLPLLNGGQLTVFAESTDTLAILQSYLTADIAGVKLTPSHISLIGESNISTSKLEVVIVGGEALLPNQVEVLRQLNPSVRIYNEYGPTEATVGCIVYEVKDINDPIYIGAPIQNTEIYIMDEAQQLVPFGAYGEIYIGGAGLSSGYLKRPELTAEKFINHPFNTAEKLYRTGDLACWTANGNIAFKGRKDHQVKIRGYRIELGEIESVLNDLEAMEQSLVLPVQDNTGMEQLVAYLVGKEVDAIAIQEYLTKQLPVYMIPKAYVVLDEMPLTTNGKIDRKALPLPDDEAYKKQEYLAPSSDREIQLASLWKNLLDIEKIGVNDNFFDLGGHSLLAIKLSFAITKSCDMKFEMNSIFKYPTIKLQAQYIDIVKAKSNEEESMNEEIVYL